MQGPEPGFCAEYTGSCLCCQIQDVVPPCLVTWIELRLRQGARDVVVNQLLVLNRHRGVVGRRFDRERAMA